MIAIIYRFKIKKGMDKQFSTNWALMTQEFRDIHGGLGSCLHQSDENLWTAYARWPDRDAFEKKKEIVNTEARSKMHECIEERLPTEVLDIKNDMLVK